MAGYKDLKVWQLSHALTLEIYKITQDFPSEEKFGIISQMRRAAYSVPSNIVEGKSRNTQKEFKHYLHISRGSIDELSYFVLLSKDLTFISYPTFDALQDRCSHIASMLNNLIKKVDNDK